MKKLYKKLYYTNKKLLKKQYKNLYYSNEKFIYFTRKFCQMRFIKCDMRKKIDLLSLAIANQIPCYAYLWSQKVSQYGDLKGLITYVTYQVITTAKTISELVRLVQNGQQTLTWWWRNTTREKKLFVTLLHDDDDAALLGRKKSNISTFQWVAWCVMRQGLLHYEDRTQDYRQYIQKESWKHKFAKIYFPIPRSIFWQIYIFSFPFGCKV